MQIMIHEAKIADVPLLIQARLDFLRTLGHAVPEEEEPAARKQIEEFLHAELGKQIFAWLAMADKQIASVGFLQVFTIMSHPNARSGRYGRIVNVLTLPEFQRQGLARAVMQRLIAHARELKLDYIGLDASPDGRHLYDSLGFIEQHADHPPMILFL